MCRTCASFASAPDGGLSVALLPLCCKPCVINPAGAMEGTTKALLWLLAALVLLALHWAAQGGWRPSYVVFPASRFRHILARETPGSTVFGRILSLGHYRGRPGGKCWPPSPGKSSKTFIPQRCCRTPSVWRTATEIQGGRDLSLTTSFGTGNEWK